LISSGVERSLNSGDFPSPSLACRLRFFRIMAKSKRKHEGVPQVTEGPTAARPQERDGATAGDLDRDRVARKAYDRYLSRGGRDGADIDDWLVAEQELLKGKPEEE
jgi:hypothetical protein